MEIIRTKKMPKLIAHGFSTTIFEINGKAYYRDISRKNTYIRAKERDYMLPSRAGAVEKALFG
jgi:hypothetical protein